MVKLNEIPIESYTKHAWFVNIEVNDNVEVQNIVKKIQNQGCVVISIDVGKTFSDMFGNFRTIISQICSSRLFLVVCVVNGTSNSELVWNLANYFRCCQLCILSTGVDDIDGHVISMDRVLSEIGSLSLRFGDVDILSGVYNSGSVSNSLRFNTLSWVNYMNSPKKEKVIFVGWHLLSLLYSMKLGMDLVVYDMATFVKPGDVTKCSSELPKFSTNRDGGYRSPNSNMKLGALAAYSLLKYDNIIVIGGYPGNEIRELNKYIISHSKKVILIDPMFEIDGYVDEVLVIKDMWNFEDSCKSNCDRLGISITKNTVFVDDTWVKDNKWDFLKSKIKTLTPTDNYDVLLKFNWYNDDGCHENLWINYYIDFILLPGMNDSTESRLLLKKSGVAKLITKSNYIHMMNVWRSLTSSEQTFKFGYYLINNIIINDNIMSVKMENLQNCFVISLFALGNVCSNFYMSDLTKWSAYGVKFVLNLYTDLPIRLSKNMQDLGSNIKYKSKYRDRKYDYIDILKLDNVNVYTLTIEKLYNMLFNYGAHRLGFLLSGEMHDIHDTVSDLNSRIILTNIPMDLECKLQSSSFSFASRLKLVTIFLRMNRCIGMNTTYMLRSELITKMLGREVCSYDNIDKGINLTGSTWHHIELEVFNGDYTLHMSDYLTEIQQNGNKLEISGHVLNLILMELIEPGSLMLWLSQIINYYKTFYKENWRRFRKAWDKGYFIEVSEDRLLKRWHTVIDLLLACVICVDYWSALIELSNRQKMCLFKISKFVYGRFKLKLEP